MKLYVEEEGTALVRQRVGEAALVATALIAYAEARAAFARRRHVGDLSPREYGGIVRTFDADWERCLRLEITETLIRDAARLAEVHQLRAYDAIHLASARVVRRRLGQAVTFASWDTDLDAAASREGFELLRGGRK